MQTTYIIPTMLTILLHCQFSFPARAQSGAATYTAIQPLLDQHTRIVAWCDLQETNLPACRDFLKQCDLHSTAMEFELNLLESERQRLEQHGVQQIWWISENPSFSSLSDCLIIPCSDTKSVQGILSAAATKRQWTTVVLHGCVVSGTPEMVKSLTQKDGDPQVSIRDALENSKAIEGIVATGNVLHSIDGLICLKSFSQAGKPDAAEDSLLKLARAAVDVNWLSLTSDRFPKSAAFRIKATSSATASIIAELTNSLLASGSAENAVKGRFAGDGSQLTLLGSSPEETIQLARRLFGLKDAETSSGSVESLKRLTIALHNFHDNYDQFPPQALVNTSGDRLMSWRVMLLPFLDQQKLYEQFHLDEPWNSEHNKQLISQMPDVFRPGNGQSPADFHTCLLAPMTENSVFGSRGLPTRIQDVTDGTSNTLLLVEADVSKAVIWTKPEDLVVDVAAPILSLAPESTTGFWASYVDGSVRFILKDNSSKVIQAIMSMNGNDTMHEEVR